MALLVARCRRCRDWLARRRILGCATLVSALPGEACRPSGNRTTTRALRGDEHDDLTQCRRNK